MVSITPFWLPIVRRLKPILGHQWLLYCHWWFNFRLHLINTYKTQWELSKKILHSLFPNLIASHVEFSIARLCVKIFSIIDYGDQKFAIEFFGHCHKTFRHKSKFLRQWKNKFQLLDQWPLSIGWLLFFEQLIIIF